MKTRAEVFAIIGESLTFCSVYWVVLATVVFGKKEMPLPGLVWPLVICLFSLFVYIIFLKKEIL